MEVRQIRFCFCRGNARETAWAVSERVAWGRLWKVGFVGSRENVRETARVMSERERRGGIGGQFAFGRGVECAANSAGGEWKKAAGGG